jgi:hypothetical protein
MGILSTPIRWVGAVVIFLFMVNTLLLIRSNKLNAQHATSWVTAELVMLILLVFDPISMFIVRLIGANNTLSAIFLLAVVWGIALILDLLVRISALSNKLRAVNQELGLLSERFDRLQQSLMTADSDIKSQVNGRE